jgi:cysteine desulfurase
MERIYLDNNATTIVDPRVKEAMEPFYSQLYGNPNSLHSFGTEVHSYMRLAIDRLYKGINAREEDDIIVNGCGSEGNNTILKTALFNFLEDRKKNHIITTSVEHPAVTNSCKFLQKMGMKVTFLPVNENGIMDAKILRDYINPDHTALVSIMWANNETGLIFPIKELAELCREKGILFHTDAVQAIGKIPVDVQEVPVDFLTFSAHKFHGPKGVGGLFMRKGRNIIPLLHGGEQMAGKRGGTVDVPGLIGMGLAMELANNNLDYELTEVKRLRDKLEQGLLEIENCLVIGRDSPRTPNTILASFKGVEGEALIWDLNQKGIAASTGSACASEDLEPNPTFVAIGIDEELAHTGIRLSLSRFTKEEEVDIAIEVIKKSVKRLRDISSHMMDDMEKMVEKREDKVR